MVEQVGSVKNLARIRDHLGEMVRGTVEETTAIIERYRRQKLGRGGSDRDVSGRHLVRRLEDITEAQWGTRMSPSTVSNLNKKIYAKIEAWRDRPIEGEHPYLYLDGIVMKRT